MRLHTVISLLSIALGSASCSPERSEKSEMNLVSKPAANEGPSLAEALSFISSRLTDQYTLPTEADISGWKPSSVRLSSDLWSWREDSFLPEALEGVGGTRKSITYTIKPSDLATPATVRSSSIVLECRVEACINRSGEVWQGGVKMSGVSIPAKTLVLNDSVPTAVLYFSTADEATRVGNAIAHALKLSGARAKAF